MNIIVVTPPPVEPVTLADVYLHLRLTPDDDSPPTHPDDAMLERQIVAARMNAESITQRSFIEQTLRIVGTRFPSGSYTPYWATYPWGQEYIWSRHGAELLRPPLIGVQSVRYYDADNVLQTVDAANYYVTDDLVPQLRFISGFVPPGCYCRSDAVRVDYVAGYPPEGSPAENYAANVPAPIKDAILIGVQLLYDELTPEKRKALEATRDALLTPYMVYTLA